MPSHQLFILSKAGVYPMIFHICCHEIMGLLLEFCWKQPLQKVGYHPIGIRIKSHIFKFAYFALTSNESHGGLVDSTVDCY